MGPMLQRVLAALSFTAALGLCLGLAPLRAVAHDIPSDVRVLAFVKPEGARLRLLVRVPLGAMNEVDMPIVGPGYLDLARADAALRVAAELWFADNVTVYEETTPLPRARVVSTRVSLASDRSFATWDSALAHINGPPIAPGTELPWKQQHFDLLLQFPIASEQSRFSIEPRLARMGLRVVTVLRLLPPRGAPERAFEWHGNPGLVHLDPRWHQVALRFVDDGFRHILDGTDHLLFIACLAIALRRLRALLVVATAFTVAHSITLAAAALGLAPSGLWFAPLVEVLIAASIVVMAVENLLQTSDRWRWLTVFAFGLVHGFGFAAALSETLQFAGSHLALSLAAFNVGVELGQVAVLLVLVPLLALARRRLPERALVIVLSAFVAHTGWHWLEDRWGTLRQFAMPTLDAATLAAALRWGVAGLLLAALLWAADRTVRRWMGNER